MLLKCGRAMLRHESAPALFLVMTQVSLLREIISGHRKHGSADGIHMCFMKSVKTSAVETTMMSMTSNTSHLYYVPTTADCKLNRRTYVDDFGIPTVTRVKTWTVATGYKTSTQ
ncbi:unnamed protein product [Spodoptera exigua]|nr:unnamed protein product [Spodoptera exigua]